MNVSWEPDVWGRVRRTVRAARENAQASAADVVNVQLILQAELALDYFQMRGLDAQQSILDATVAADEKALLLTNQLFHAGLDSQLDVQQAQTQLEMTRAQDQDVGIARAQDEHAIAILIGEPPASLTIPARVVAIHSRLRFRRVCLRSCWNGVRISPSQNARWPLRTSRSALLAPHTIRIFLFPVSADLIAAARETGSPAQAPSGPWDCRPPIRWWTGDNVMRSNTMAQANYDGTVANYRQTVLTAYQEVEDNLVALHILQRETQTQNLAVASAQQQMDIAMKLYTARTGSVFERDSGAERGSVEPVDVGKSGHSSHDR